MAKKEEAGAAPYRGFKEVFESDSFQQLLSAADKESEDRAIQELLDMPVSPQVN